MSWLDNVWFFDFEVLKEDWIISVKNYKTKERFRVHNNPLKVMNFLRENPNIILFAYNNKHYDNYILKGVLQNMSPKQIKDISDFIIQDGNVGWEYPYPNPYLKLPFTSDLMNDCAQRLSLKEIEGYLGLNIVECSIPFDIDRKLTKPEIKILMKYCDYDVDAVEALFEQRMDYLNAKIYIGAMAGLEVGKALYFTNAQLTAELLQAEATTRDDEFDYKIPVNLIDDYIPIPVKDFVKKYQNKEIKIGKTDEYGNVVSSKNKFNLNFDLLGVPHIFALGGLHGALLQESECSDDEYVLILDDVESYYPALMEEYDYMSRNISEESKQYYFDLKKERVEIKETDAVRATALKLPLNGCFGASLASTNKLYDPLNGRSACISGQLFLIELVTMLDKGLDYFKLIQSNTDGVLYKIRRTEWDKAREIKKRWERKNRFKLAENVIDAIFQKDVNNYVYYTVDDKANKKIKTKGTYVKNYKGGNWENANVPIVAKAIVEYLVNGVPVEDTIRGCKNLLDFQYIAKVGSTYNKAQLVK